MSVSRVCGSPVLWLIWSRAISIGPLIASEHSQFPLRGYIILVGTRASLR